MNPVENVQMGPVKVQLTARDDRIVSHIRSGRGFEPQSRPLWGGWCAEAKSRTVLDIGAYSGLFAIAAALVGCKAIAFEPIRVNAVRALTNAALNRVAVALHQVAVSDRSGTIDLTFNPNVAGMTAGASLIRKKGEKLKVRTLTIDELAISDVAAIKIDVERAEPMVLRGAAQTLALWRPKLLVEALGAEERKAVLAAVPGYELADVIDTRNLVLLPK